jgi:GTP-binding protein YchF
MRGGESATPTLTATVFPPHSAESRSTSAMAPASRSRGACVAGAMSQGSVHSVVVRLGIIGFPGGGKTTLFNLLTGAEASVAQAPGRGRLNVGVVRVPDDRVTRLAALFQPKKTVYATVEVVDLAGFDRGERATLDVGELRQADALLHVVRVFPSPALGAAPVPAREVQSLEEELVLADLEIVERRIQKLGPGLKRKPTDAEQREHALLARVQGPLEEGVSLREQALTAEEARLLRGFQFLSLKPILHCLNLAEDAVDGRAQALSELDEAGKRAATLVGWVSAAVESEVAALAAEEQRSFLDALGLPEPALHRVIRDAYTLLGLASFFTVGEDEVRAWTIPAGAAAVDAAAAIHSDIARGFIRAEVIGWAELLEAGSLAEARKRALLRLEGKDYPVQNGEVCHFRFNVGR